jgi:serine/threonine-protein kinase RsbW
MPGDKRLQRARQAEGHASERFEFGGDAAGVRDGLARMFRRPMLARLSEECRGTVEIVLAEVLNNIAEHAYARFPGRIEVELTAHDSFLFVRTQDQGLAMPGEQVPWGRLEPVAGIQDLPEGGFGWYLIRSLTQELTYLRQDGTNHLSFCIDVDYQR